MKKILLFAFLLCSFSAFAQYPATPTTKQELGRQTTGDGLIYRGSGTPAYTPSSNRNAWIYYDTLNNRLFRNRGGAWALMIKDTSATNEIQLPYIVDDTLYLTQNITGEPLTRYVNRVWPIAALSDTTSITGEQQGDVAFVTSGTAVAFRGSSYWNPFSGGGSFSGFNVAGDTGSSAIASGGTVTVAGGYGINTAETGGTVTVAADTTQLVTQDDIADVMYDWRVVADAGPVTTITDSEILTVSGGTGLSSVISGNTITVNLDNTAVTPNTYGSATQVSQNTFDAQGRATGASNVSIQIAQNQVTGLPDSISAAPSGTGTNLRIPLWTGSASLGSSTLLQSATGQTLDANLAFRMTGGTTVSRPTGAAGMMYWNTSNTWLDIHNGTAWFNPARSSTTNGLFTSGSVLFATTTGTIHQDNASFFFDDTNNRLGLGTTTPIFTVSAVANNTDTGMGAFAHSATASQRSVFALLRSRGTSSTPTTVVNGDLIGSFTGNGHDGSGYQTTARIDFAVSGVVSTNTVPQRISFTTGTTEANRAERMTVLHDGNVGVGTLTPDRLFHSELSGSATNSVGFPLRLTHITSGTATAGFGTGLEMESESGGGTNRVMATITSSYNDATNTSEDADVYVNAIRAGTLTNAAKFGSDGSFQVGTLTGTGAKLGGYTSGNIATELTVGTGLSLSGGTLSATAPTPVYGKFTGTTNASGLISITLSATPVTGACTCTNNATTGVSFRYLFSANWTSGTNVDVRVYDTDTFALLASGSVNFSIICF